MLRLPQGVLFLLLLHGVKYSSQVTPVAPTHFSYYTLSLQTYLISYSDIQYNISNLLMK